MKSFSTVFISTILLCVFASAEDASSESKTLSIGDPAPALAVEHWLSNGDGKFSEVTAYEKDKVYVLDFWATWCGPCVASMPHLEATQKKYADQKLQIISISDEKLSTVKQFLRKDVRGAADKTYEALTRSWSLTTDPDKSVYEDYMVAAGQNGIPTVFVVGKTGHVEWIGHPMAMDGPLDQIVKGTWDHKEYALEFAEQKQLETAAMKMFKALQREKGDKAIKIADAAMAELKSEKVKSKLRMLKLRVLCELEGRQDAIASIVGELLGGVKPDDAPQSVNELTWTIYELSEQGKISDKAVLKKAAELSEQAAEREAAGQGKAMILDTAAHLHEVIGNKARAIELQGKAVENDKTSDEIRDYLKALEKQAL